MRILIATVTAGAGHLAAASALSEAWRAWRPGDTVEQVDLVRYFSALHRKIVSDGYVKLVNHAPELWGMVFAKTDSPELARRLNRIKARFPSKSRALFARHVRNFRPDVVLCTHYLPLEILGGMRQKNAEAKPFVVSIVTDFEAHALWMESCVDLYCVAAEQTRARLVARGAVPDKIVATGIPISGRFSAKIDPKRVRRQHGLRDDLPILLVLSGGFGMGPVGTGRNEELRRELAARDYRHPTRVLGFSSNMHELMSVADLVISKPGGLTTSEALALGKPLFILNPIPGQEAANSDFLLERGAAAKANRVEDLPFRLEQLLGSRKLVEMSKAARALGRPDAAAEICREVLERCGVKSPSAAAATL
jgi:processive 1,2-diacylglycerol beta-glucosyltransferase